MNWLSRLLLPLSLFSAAACGGGDTLNATPDSETLVGVDPNDFAVGMDCGESQGLESYVARLVDVTDGLVSNSDRLEEYPVQTSPPTSCQRTITLGLVMEGRSYVVDVDGYMDVDGNPEHIDVCSVDGTSALLRRTDEECDGAYVAPDHTWRCYGWQTSESTDQLEDGSSAPEEPGRPGISLEYRTVLLHYCVDRSEE